MSQATLTSRRFEVLDLVQVIATDAHEGPVYAADEDALWFTSVPVWRDGVPETQVRRLQLDGHRFPLESARESVVIARANMANGMALDHEGGLVICEQGTPSSHARMSRLDRATGRRSTLVAAWCGLRLNSPNDVAVADDGALWFTDPSYGHLQGFKPSPVVGDYVYRHDPHSGHLSVVAASLDKPNGLAFSPDGGTLYLADNGGPHHLLAFEVEDGLRLARGRILADCAPEYPDGVKVDGAGRIWIADAGGVRVLSPAGEELGLIELPGAVNFCFGGPDRDLLFITTDDAIWAAVLEEGA